MLSKFSQIILKETNLNNISYFLIKICFKNNTIRCKKLTTIISGCCYFSALVLTCFPLTKGRAMFFLTWNNCCEFLAFYGDITQSVIQSFLKTSVCGASLSHHSKRSKFDSWLGHFLLTWRGGGEENQTCTPNYL